MVRWYPLHRLSSYELNPVIVGKNERSEGHEHEFKQPQGLKRAVSSSIEGEDVHHWEHSGKRSPRLEGTGLPSSVFHFVVNVVPRWDRTHTEHGL